MHRVNNLTLLRVWQQWLVLIAPRDTVKAVHVRHIEPIAIAAPDFIEDLIPFFSGHAIDYEARGRNWFARFVALRRRIIQTKTWPLPRQDFRTVARHRIAATQIVNQRRLFSIFQRKEF